MYQEKNTHNSSDCIIRDVRGRWLNLEDFEAVSEAWDSLVAKTVARGAFLRSWFLRARWLYTPEHVKQGIYVLYDGQKMAAGIPVRIRISGRYLPRRILQSLAAPRADFFAIPCLPGYEASLAANFVTALEGKHWRIDALSLTHMDGYGPAENALIDALEMAGWQVQLSQHSGFSFLDVTHQKDQERDRYLKKQFADTERRRRRMEEAGHNLSCEVLTKNLFRELAPLLPMLGKRRREKNQTNNWIKKTNRAFLEEAIAGAECKEEVRLTMLRDETTRVRAFCLDWCFNGVRFGYLTGFDTTWRQWAPGLQLLWANIQETIRDESLKEFNFGKGIAQYKTKQATKLCVYQRIDATPPPNLSLSIREGLWQFRKVIMDRTPTVAQNQSFVAWRFIRKQIRRRSLEFIMWELDKIELKEIDVPQGLVLRLLGPKEARETGFSPFCAAARKSLLTAAFFDVTGVSEPEKPIAWFSIASTSPFVILERPITIPVQVPKGDAVLFRGFTEPAWRGLGLYPKLTTVLLQWARQQKFCRVWVYYEQHNIPSKRGLLKADRSGNVIGSVSAYKFGPLRWSVIPALKRLGVSINGSQLHF